jgi:HEPN domain-containing protein
MNLTDALRKEAGKWLREAAKDLHSAKLLLVPVDPEPSRALFHSQQAAEKAAKAFLAFRNVPFRKTHDLADLGLQCASLDPGLGPVLIEAADLTKFAVGFRYPDAPYEPDAEEAAESLEIAEKLCREVRLRVADPAVAEEVGGEVAGEPEPTESSASQPEKSKEPRA